MKKKNLNRNYKGFDDESNFNSGKASMPKGKDSKRKFSIYDDYEDEDEFISYEKFKKRHK